MTPDDERWTCGYCGQRYVVTVLARDCEAKHERETSCEPTKPPTSSPNSKL
jgi:hypothetical protein